MADLQPWVVARCTNRRRGMPEPFDLDLSTRLSEAVKPHGATLHLVTERARVERCAEVLAAADRIRYLTPVLHRDMVSELRWPGDDLRTGIDVRTLELTSADMATLEVLRREDVMALLAQWNGGAALATPTADAVRASSALAVLTVPHASPEAYVRGGGALEHLWITAQQAGLGVQPISPPFVFAVQRADFELLGGQRWAEELAALREKLRVVVGMGTTEVFVLLLRLSHVAPPTTRSLRRPLEEVLSPAV